MRHANRDTDHLNTLRQYFAQNRRIPSYQRIADLLGCQRRLNIDPPCRSNIDPGRVAEF